MGRRASVRVKNGYWYSEAGKKGQYFGRVDEMTKTQATKLLYKALVGEEPTPSTTLTPSPEFRVSDLRDKYLDWVQRHRSDRLYKESERHLRRFCQKYGEMQAGKIDGGHLEAFQDALQAQGHATLYVKKHSTTIRTAFNRAVKAGWLPHDFRPFARVEGIRIDPQPLLESDLPTEDEIRAVKAEAKGLMADLIAVYHSTGCRTHELLEARVGDFQPNSRTIVLGRHKRSKTMKSPTPRTITLNAEVYGIIQRYCQGRGPDEPIIANGNGKPFNSHKIGNKFQALRDRVKARDNFTIYSFRHLWISECLMLGLDALLVSRMAGTSVAMLERVYGHFRSQSLHDAQSRLDLFRAK